MPRPSNKAIRRQEIIRGLMSVMATTGYENASIQAIAKAAGLAPGLIHYHFKNKKEILIELVNLVIRTMEERFLARCKDASSPAQKIDAFVEAALALGDDADEELVAAWVMIASEAMRHEDIQKLYENVIKQNTLLLASLLQEYTQGSKSEMKKIAVMCIASIEGLYQLSQTTKDILPSGFAADTLKNLVFSSLTP
ncbi:HTH-type transcriptional repressor KstR2 [Thalassocella blandensis]|nr:HTH-type transcriptional repressor KstR2 [Thalassocella blandensis]